MHVMLQTQDILRGFPSASLEFYSSPSFPLCPLDPTVKDGAATGVDADEWSMVGRAPRLRVLILELYRLCTQSAMTCELPNNDNETKVKTDLTL